MPRQTTNEDLAGMIKEGFDEVGRRFDTVERRLDRIEGVILEDHEHRIKRLEDALVPQGPLKR